MGRCGLTLLLTLVAMIGGCSAKQRNRACPDDLGTDPMVALATSPHSVLMGGQGGFEDAALDMGRSDWPSAYRDGFEGESVSYLERYYDVQSSPAAGYYGGRGYTQQQFNSYRAGSYQR